MSRAIEFEGGVHRMPPFCVKEIEFVVFLAHIVGTRVVPVPPKSHLVAAVFRFSRDKPLVVIAAAGSLHRDPSRPKALGSQIAIGASQLWIGAFRELVGKMIDETAHCGQKPPPCREDGMDNA